VTTLALPSFFWLWLTNRCQLECSMCYAESSPAGTHGSMTREDWINVIDQAAGLGASAVKIIGGEPTLHPDFAALTVHALSRGLDVEVLTNLVHVTDDLWSLFERPGVSVSTSYFSDDAKQHNKITGRPSYARTRANIAEAVRRGIPVRAGVIDVDDGQRVEQAHAELVELGVPSIGYDRARQIGRGQRDQRADATQLCGRCGDGVASIGPDGEVRACVFAGWTESMGDIRQTSLAELASRLPVVHQDLVAAGMPNTRTGECTPVTTGSNCYPHNRGTLLSDPCRPTTTGTNCYPHNDRP
jgi:MoaA/NifB/PqqE/SkfB family radical SAM enzyme